MQKAHDSAMNEYWRNKPDLSTPIVAEKKNQLEVAVDTIDNRVIVLDTTKANQTDMLQAVKTIAYTESTGTFRITFFNNTYVDIDTDLEKLAVNFDYDDNPQSAHYQNLIITLDDGTVKYVDLSALITQYEFLSTSTIQAVVGADGSISFNVINGSITEEKLEPNFLANCRLEVSKALGFSQDAEAWAKGTKGGTPVASTDEHYHNNSKYYSEVAHTEADNATTKAQDSEAWAVGKRNGQDVPSTDETYHNNAKYWAEQAEGAVTGNDKVTWEANGILGAKQLIPYPYYHTTRTVNGITWTVNDDDGTVTANGTATARSEFAIRSRLMESFKLPVGEYLLSGCAPNGGSGRWAMATYYTTPSNTGANLVFDYGLTGDRPLNITNEMMSQYFTIGISLVIQSGVTADNLVFKPMIRLAEDTDDTYQPHAMTNRELTLYKASQAEVDDIVNVYGAKQMIVYPYQESSVTRNGITYTDNGDGTITASGTASADANFYMHTSVSTQLQPIKAGKYTLTNGLSDNSNSTYKTRIRLTTDHGATYYKGVDLESESVIFNVEQDCEYAIYFWIVSGKTVSNVTFKPLLTPASVTNRIYEPYAKTNQQLTKDVDSINTTLESKQNASDNSLNTTNKTVVGAINEVNNGLSTLTTKLGNYLSVVTYSRTSTVSANTGGMLKEDISSIIPSGKVPIGIMGCSFPGNTSFGTNEIIVENGVYKYHGLVMNHTSSAITGEWKVYILCAG